MLCKTKQNVQWFRNKLKQKPKKIGKRRNRSDKSTKFLVCISRVTASYQWFRTLAASCSFMFGLRVWPLNPLFPWVVGNLHLAKCVLGPHKRICKITSKSVKKFKRSAQVWHPEIIRQMRKCVGISESLLLWERFCVMSAQCTADTKK